jgi:AhpC/TSA family/Disulphide bond corrector protein DsbC
VELQEKLSDIRKQGLGVAAISYDTQAVLKNFAERRGITFPLLSDEGSNTIRAFGILNEQVTAGTLFFGIPYPGTYIVDPSGRVVSKYFEEDYTQRFTASDILVREYGSAAGAAHTSIETKHLRLSSSASADRVRSGQRIALTIDVDLKPGMHVYAPGVEGYIPIEWSMASSEAIIAHPVVTPQPRKLHLAAIDETVPVYAGQFRLVRDITLAKDTTLKSLLDPSGNLTIEGTFRYQACDDRMCYVPQTVPLKWTLHVEAPDRERAPASLQKKPGN